MNTMSTASTQNPTATARLKGILASRGFRRMLGALNLFALVVAAAFVGLGTRSVLESQRKVRDLQAEYASLEGRREALARRVESLEQRNASLEEQLNTLNGVLLQKKDELRELVKEVDLNDPDITIERARQNLKGKTPGERADALWRYGRDAFAAGRTNVAERLFLESLKEDSSFAPAHIGLGRIAADRQQYRVAERHYVRAASADPKNPHAAYNLALARFLMKNYSMARVEALRALSIDPGYGAAKELLASIAQAEKAAAP